MSVRPTSLEAILHTRLEDLGSHIDHQCAPARRNGADGAVRLAQGAFGL
jgi:hypothetical protein